DFLRFLFSWHRLEGDERPKGPEALAATLAQLEGFEAAAAAWEGEILPARVGDYDPVWLDALCLAGRVVWGRLAPPQTPEARRSGPVRATPIALLGRQELAGWREISPGLPGTSAGELELSGGARAVHDFLRQRGASFFAEVAASTGLLNTQVEEALSELVAWGLATADS